MPDVSVIIVNYRGWMRLEKCLDSLAVIPESKLTFEVIVVDNASNDGLLTGFENKYSRFRFIENDGNNGFANGCNLGAKYALSDYLLFLNPDTVIRENAILGLLNQVRISKPNSIISSRQIREDGSEERPYGDFLTMFTLTGWLRALNRIFKRKKQQESSISPDWVSGSVVMISKDCYSNIGGWDEDFWMYFEDVDLCKRIRKAGGDIFFLKNVTVEHNHGGSSRVNASVTALTKTEVNISRHVYLSKHEKGLKGTGMQIFLVFNNLLTGVIPAFLGLLLFFNKSRRVDLVIYTSLIKYYLNALVHETWLSPRSVRYRK